MFNSKKIEFVNNKVEDLAEKMVELREMQNKLSIQIEELHNELIILKYKNEEK